MLIVENLSYTYTDTQVLENIHFTLAQGEVLSIVGASGSGKSTLLKALYGLFDLSQGIIFWNGTPVLGPSHNLVPGFPKIFGTGFWSDALYDSGGKCGKIPLKSGFA